MIGQIIIVDAYYLNMVPVRVNEVDRQAEFVGYTPHVLNWVGLVIVVLQEVKHTLA